MWLTVFLAASLAQAPEVGDDAEPPDEGRSLAFTVELTGGRQLGASGFVDGEVVRDLLFLNAGYTLLKTPALPATDTTPAVPTAPTHIFSGGVDLMPGRHFTFSLLVSGSPKATDQVVLNPSAPPAARLTVSTWRSNVGGTLLAAYSSAGFSKFEWVVDVGGSVTSNRLGRGVRALGPGTSAEEGLISGRVLLGFTATLLDHTDLSLRGGVNAYSANPLTVGRFSQAETLEIGRVFLNNALAAEIDAIAYAAQQASARLAQADSLSGYASAPVFIEARFLFTRRFARRFSLQLGFTFNRYVPTAGYAIVLSSKLTVRLGDRWRLWGGAAVQYDEPIDQPRYRTASDPKPSVSGVGTLGVELTL